MVSLFKQLAIIVKTGITSLFYDIDGNKRTNMQFIVFLVFIPLAILVFIIWKQIKLSESIDTLLTVLTIFTALIFGVLFTVPDKLSNRIEKYKNRKDEAIKNYLTRFYNFTKSFVEQITFIILISLVLIVLLVILKITDKIIFEYLGCIQIMITALSSVLFYYLLLYILVLLANIYILLMDDIKVSNKDK